jgi:hypothetical protein
MSTAMYVQTNTYLDNLKRDFPEYPAIVFLYMWDIIRDVFTEVQDAVDGDSGYGDLTPLPGITLEEVWNEFTKDVWGGLDVDSHNVIEWLFSKNLIQDYQEEADSE